MSRYTTEVRFICEYSIGLTHSDGFNAIEYKSAENPGILYQAAPLVFNFNFPIFDESYRRPLEMKILRHYYTREICEETVGLWKLRLCDRLNMIMPYYNQLYQSALLKFNPFYDVDYSRTHSRKSSGKEETESSGNSTAVDSETNTGEANSSSSNTYRGTDTAGGTKWDLYSDTPQGGIEGITGETGETVNNNYYLTNARKITDNTTDTINSSGTVNDTERSRNDTQRNSQAETQNNETRNIANTEDYIEKVVGKTNGQSYSNLLQQFRKTMLNIDQKIIEDLSDLFFGLWQ